VLLDEVLAQLYGVETRALVQAVKRNLARFPGAFMFQLTASEWAALRSQAVTLKAGCGQHRKYLPYAFTEQGVAHWRAIAVHCTITPTWCTRPFLTSHSSRASFHARVE
jgi:hypothetical protein